VDLNPDGDGGPCASFGGGARLGMFWTGGGQRLKRKLSTNSYSDEPVGKGGERITAALTYRGGRGKITEPEGGL